MIHGCGFTEVWRRQQPLMNPNEIHKFTNLPTNLQNHPITAARKPLPIPYKKWLMEKLFQLRHEQVLRVTVLMKNFNHLDS
jgi:hypothetical protein